MTFYFMITLGILVLLTLASSLPTSAALHPLHGGGRRNQEDPSQLPDGIWTFRGYGYVIQVTNGTATLFEETDISCIVNPILLMGVTGTQVEGDVANITVFRFIPYFVLDRTDSFQSACAQGITPVISDENYTRNALEVFDILDQTFVEHFAHFENRLDGGMSEWVMKTMEARANLTSDSTDDELVSTFQSLLIPLDEYHTWVQDANGEFLAWSHEFLWQFQDEFEQQNAISDWGTYQEEKIFIPWRDNAASYMENDLTLEDSGLAWGRTAENIGYMWMWTVPNDIQSFGADFEAAMLALNGTDALVFDIRINAGGSDQTAIFIASHFTSEPYLAMTKQTVGGDVVEVYVQPSEMMYTGPVVMIISGAAYSAAETLPLALLPLPQVTLLGDNTGGSYSELPKMLPNGWAFSLFSEVYLSIDGIDYDQVGIPPNILPETDLLPLSEREAGVDSWLELALQTAQNNAASFTSGASKVLQYGTLLWLASVLLPFVIV